MLKITSLTGLSVILQLLINVVSKKTIGSSGNEKKIPSILFTFKKLTRAGYLTSGARKTFNYLRHAFI